MDFLWFLLFLHIFYYVLHVFMDFFLSFGSIPMEIPLMVPAWIFPNQTERDKVRLFTLLSLKVIFYRFLMEVSGVKADFYLALKLWLFILPLSHVFCYGFCAPANDSEIRWNIIARCWMKEIYGISTHTPPTIFNFITIHFFSTFFCFQKKNRVHYIFFALFLVTERKIK